MIAQRSYLEINEAGNPFYAFRGVQPFGVAFCLSLILVPLVGTAITRRPKWLAHRQSLLAGTSLLRHANSVLHAGNLLHVTGVAPALPRHLGAHLVSQV